MAWRRDGALRIVADLARRYLVESNRYRALHALNVRGYAAVERLLGPRIGRIPGVRAVYLAHGLALGECFPGFTDFDLVVVFDAPDRPQFYERIRQWWLATRRFVPISDMMLISMTEFELWQALGGGGDPLDEVVHWRRLWGDELRRDGLDASGESSEHDRLAYGLGHFQNLMQVAIKEEHRSPGFAVFARRQLYKSFFGALLAQDRRYLAIPEQRRRVDAWIDEHGAPAPANELRAMHRERFGRGPVTRMRHAASALAYRTINETPALLRCASLPLRPPSLLDAPPRPIANQREVESRVATMTRSIVGLLGDGLECVLLGSTGSVRGYAYYVVLRDDLSDAAVAKASLDLRAAFRVFDDPWFNEHFPGGLPTIYSRSMFLARLRLTRTSLHYLHRFRRVLHGSDLYAQALASNAADDTGALSADDLLRDRLSYSIHVNQIYLQRLKPALHDFVTLYAPRIALLQATGRGPATAEEASEHYARLHGAPAAALPGRFLRDLGGKDVDGLHRTLGEADFAEAWPLLRASLVGAGDLGR
jgi:hypothetical protein